MLYVLNVIKEDIMLMIVDKLEIKVEVVEEEILKVINILIIRLS
jgi:hypothetical protein